MRTEHELPVYEPLVREFYTNLTFDTDTTTITTKVKGTKIILTTSSLAEILEVPNTGIELFQPKEWPLTQDRKTVVSYFNPEPNPLNPFEIKASKLSPLHKVLFWIVHDNVVPMDGGRGPISMAILAYMYLIETHKQINLPYLMLHHMNWIVTSKRNTHLGYGSYLTKIFSHYHIPFPTKKVLLPDDLSKFGENRLRHFHVVVRENKLVPDKHAEESVPPAAARVPVPETGPSSGATGPAPSSSSISSLLSGLESAMNMRLDDISRRLKSLEENHAQLNDKVIDGLQSLRHDVLTRLDEMESDKLGVQSECSSPS